MNEKSSPYSWMWVKNQVARAVLGICIPMWEVSLRSKPNYKGGQNQESWGQWSCDHTSWQAPKQNELWNLLCFWFSGSVTVSQFESDCPLLETSELLPDDYLEIPTVLLPLFSSHFWPKWAPNKEVLVVTLHSALYWPWENFLTSASEVAYQ